jgi:hypothetical protein
MSAPCTRDELQRRFRVYERQRSFVSVIGFGPLLVIYVLVHTRYLNPWLPQSRGGELVVLLLLPAAWFAAVMLLHAWLAPPRLGLQCPKCRHRLLGRAFIDAMSTGQCDSCRAAVVSDLKRAD